MKHFFNFKNLISNKKFSENELKNKNYFLKENYKNRKKPEYFESEEKRKKNIIYQPDVYCLLKLFATRFSCKNIIDIGCGSGEKLIPLSKEFEIIGLDYGPNIKYCNKKYNFGKWIEHDFEKSKPVKLSPDILNNSAIVCADVIEHLVNPSNLLKIIKNFLIYAPFCLLSTPERDLVRGIDDIGPPKNTHHVREWNMSELEKLIQYYEINLAFKGLTANNDEDSKQQTILMAFKNSKFNENLELWKISNREQTKIVQYY